MPALSVFQILITSLWTGGAIITGYLAVPVIFKTLKPQTDLAGTVAGNIFAAMSWMGLTIGLILIVCFIAQNGMDILRRTRSVLVLVIMSLISVNQFILHPQILVTRVQRAGGDIEAAALFKWLHGGASIIFLILSLLGIWLLIHLIRLLSNKPTIGSDPNVQ